MSTKNLSLPVIVFIFIGIIWGSNFIYMKMASEYLSSIQIAFFRVLFGFIPVLIYAFYKGSIKIEHYRHIFHFLVMAILASSVYYIMYAKAASLLLTGVAGTLSGSIPIFSFILGLIFLEDERATRLKVLGVLIGFAGIVLISRPFEQNLATTNTEGILYMLIGSLTIGSSFVYARKYVTPLNIPAAALTAYQLGLGILLMAFFTDFSSASKIMNDTHALFGLIIGLGLLGTGVAFIMYYYLVEKLGAITASSSTYLPPVVALIIGSILVKEPISLFEYISAALILAGVFLLKKRRCA
jgi:drug/metabolite transporter (DMT)-like permease